MGAKLQVLINKKLKMHFQIGDNLRPIHYDQLVDSNHQDIALTLLTGFKLQLDHNCQTEEEHLHIKIVTALLLYNDCTLLNMMEICVTNSNKLKIHPSGMATLKKMYIILPNFDWLTLLKRPSSFLLIQQQQVMFFFYNVIIMW